ncbi:MAG: hypothetical protein ABI972_05800 [Acidobacteriota bacterium]
MRTAIYRWVRWVMIHSDWGPLRWLYRAAYAAAQHAAVALLRRQPGVVAVYARRGMARGSIQPGISDIDMILIGSQPLAANPAAYLAYQKLAGYLPILDKNVLWLGAGFLQEEYERRATVRYALRDGPSSMKLLWGARAMARVQPQTNEDAGPAMIYGLVLCWRVTTRLLLDRDTTAEDPILATSVAARMAGELARAERRFLRGEAEVDRIEALAARAAEMDGESRALATELVAAAASGYRQTVRGAGPRSVHYMFGETRRLLASLASTEFGMSGRPAEIVVDAPLAELRIDERVQQHLDWLQEAFHSMCGNAFGGLRAVPSVFHKPPHCTVLVELTGDAPACKGWPDLIRQHQNACEDLPAPVHLFWNAPEGALPLGHLVRRRRAESFLAPHVHFDSKGAGGGPHAVTPWLRFAVQEALWIATNRSHLPCPGEWAERHPVRDFWWILQLQLLAETLDSSEVWFASTPEAVQRRLKATGRALPRPLEPLLEALYLPESAAKNEVGALLPEAADFMEQFLSAQAEEFRLVLDTWRGIPSAAALRAR